MMPSEVELAARLVLAALLGGLIGVEREMAEQPAGLRTHISVALGSALFVVAGAYGFGEFVDRRADTNVQISVDRVASTVVTGVGFLGGGAILKHGASVRGLTTAASLWVTAAIGMAAALGSYAMSVVTTAILLVALAGLRAPRRWLAKRRVTRRSSVSVTMTPGASAGDIVKALDELDGVEVRELAVRTREGAWVVEADLQADGGADLEGRLTEILERPDVAAVDVVS